MSPSPGRIHSLPVKILYSIDTSTRSYLAVLDERQDVYVHPNTLAYTHDETHGPLGSCCLKAIARGICFASPECIPNQSTLDFSVYNLDPSLRGNRVTRAFSTTTNDESSAWTGRGFLSWLLAEPGQGSTLIRGRLVREYEFSPAAVHDGGGLEGLMAAAVRREDTDGKGWGLEVCVSLKEVNPEGKGEFSGRREFEEMLASGRPLGSTTTTPRADPDARPQVRANGMHLPGSNPASIAPIRAPQSQTTHHASSSNRGSLPSSLPPSSIPMASSSSKPGIPSRPSSAAPRQTPTPIASAPPPRPTTPPRHITPRRHGTPPPPPQRRSPPPSTPSRATLHALLRSDGKMSPELASKLASNPMLLRLLKAVPPSAGSLNLAETKASPAADTPTPSTSTTIKYASTEGCCNCGTLESELWRTKAMKDGTKKKVCNACGLYFNKFKRMRPPDLWGDSSHPRAKTEPEAPIRSSPRLRRSTPDNAGVNDSPRKRQRLGKMPQPSPRMATRASAKTDSGPSTGKTLDFGDGLFSPSSIFETSPANGNGNALGAGSTEGEVDIESLLAQFANDQPGFNLDALFASATGGEGGGQEMMDLLSAWEGTTDGASGSVSHKQGTG